MTDQTTTPEAEESTASNSTQLLPTLEQQLKVGTKIKLGKEYCKGTGFKPGTIITLELGEFDHWNGLYEEVQTAPSIWDEDDEDYSSIYHLFGNDLEDFADCEILSG